MSGRQKEELKETIIKAIEDRIYKKQDKIITIPVETKKPEELNIENIYKDIYKEVSASGVEHRRTEVRCDGRRTIQRTA